MEKIALNEILSINEKEIDTITGMFLILHCKLYITYNVKLKTYRL